MKKLFYLASGIILCASFLPKEVNARKFFNSELFKTKETPDFLRYSKETCQIKKGYGYTLKTGRLAGMPMAVIGKKYGRLFKSPGEAKMFFQAICSSPTPVKMMKKGIIIK